MNRFNHNKIKLLLHPLHIVGHCDKTTAELMESEHFSWKMSSENVHFPP